MSDESPSGFEVATTFGKSIRTRRRIVDVAHDLFTERGFDNVTVSQIADAVGVTERTIYRHFESKEDLLLVWIDEAIPRYLALVRQRPANEDHFSACCEAFVALVGSDEGSPVSPFLVAADSASMSVTPRALAKLIAWEGALSACLANRAKESPYAPSLSTQLAASMVMNTLHFSLRQFVLKQSSVRRRLSHAELSDVGRSVFSTLRTLVHQ
jgi:AcrR family transcriptional regulator